MADVAPTSMYVAAKVDRPQKLRIALQVANSMSRGSATSVGEILGVGLLVRSAGVIVAHPDAAPAPFDFGAGPVDSVVRARIDTVNGYSYTPLAAVAALRQLVAGQWTPGFQTPATVFGAGFALAIADTRIVDMA